MRAPPKKTVAVDLIWCNEHHMQPFEGVFARPTSPQIRDHHPYNPGFAARLYEARNMRVRLERDPADRVT
jgi:hypothetical protein